MREPIYPCPSCKAHLPESHMAGIEDPDHGYCFNCEEIVRKSKQIGERIHLNTKVELPGACNELESLAAGAEEFATRLRKLDGEGFEIVHHSGTGHYYLEKIEESESEYEVDEPLK